MAIEMICFDCRSCMVEKPDDQLPKGWKYFHCDKCNKGEPVKDIDGITEEELSKMRYEDWFPDEGHK